MSLKDVLSDPKNFFNTKCNDYQFAILDNLIKLPVDKVFPCLDLYRIFLLHPDCSMHYKKFEEGAGRVYSLCSPLTQQGAGDPARMLAMRCLCNLFREQTAIFVMRKKAVQVVKSVIPHLQNSKNTVREAAITVLLNYSVVIL